MNTIDYDFESELTKFVKNTIIYNDSFEPKEVELGNNFYDVTGKKITGKLILKPLEAKILFCN